jgi:hypothetical protein
MPNTFALPIVGGLSILAAGGGVWLGKSSVAQINPVYFSEREARFHADLAPNRGVAWDQVQTAEFQQAALATDYGTFCLGCIDYPEDVHPIGPRERDGIEDGWAASAPEEQEIETETVETARQPEWERVERYASYPVTADKPAIERAVVEQPAVAEPVSDDPVAEEAPVEG